MNQRLLFLLCLLLSLVIPRSACANPDGSAPTDGDPDVAASVPAAEQSLPSEKAEQAGLPAGVTIEELFSYSGAYVEDGSNVPCENICAVRLYNASSTHYQYLRFSLQTSGGAYTFAASTLFAGARMTVLCEEKTPLEGNGILATELLTSVPFVEPPSVHTDTLEITYADGFINVRNLTESPLSRVYVYYKDTDGNGYLGGITYRVSFGEIPAGETVQTAAANMRRATCRVVFATYDG